jgi:two-component system CheB/CheR fusion protein
MPKTSRVASPKHQLPFPVVGLGASAGGIEALSKFLETMPGTSGAAFVVVLHVSPQGTSALAQVLAPFTSMPVIEVTGSTRVEPNHVYVIAPGLTLTLVDGALEVQPSAGVPGRRAEIDLFFRSLAEAQRERAVSIVLSGAGSDGSVGIARVKELGGITFAQDPDDAQCDSMPSAAIATGMIDVKLPVGEMPQRLISLWADARATQLPTITSEDAPPESAGDERALREITIILRTRTGHDFRHYKRATVLRRIERRMQVNGVHGLDEYRDFLHVHPEETPLLLQDMLISVTNFFRDREAFDALRDEVLPNLLHNRPNGDPVRVWAAGCATGEEAYSLAMLLHEAMSKKGLATDFQVFATDIDERAIAAAREGIYPEAIFTDVDPGLIRRYFTKEGAQYRVTKELRDHLLFAAHNVLSDPPFSRIDLVCCRNLLIYLDRQAQADILRTFHFALRPGGYLFLGASEAADTAGDLFDVVDKKARLFRASVLARAVTPVPASALGTIGARASVSVMQPSGTRKFSFGDLHQRLVEQYAPPSVLVSRDWEIVHLSDRAGRFLHYAGGEPSHNILSAVRPDLRLELRTAIYQALQTQRSVDARRVRLERDGRWYFVNMIARPVHDAESSADFVLVLFDEVEDSMEGSESTHGDDERDPIIVQLERELQRTKEQLQATIEQSETSTEELRASNEELQATNEELRSASEELETSKEELQSINEELTTVNAELKAKVDETSKINDDLQNLIAANDIGTIFVDRDLRIKRYTPRACDVFSLIPTDIGRSLLDITHRLDYDGLTDDAINAFDSLRLVEREVKSDDGRWYLARILPYRTTENRIDGAVLSFLDVTSRRSAEDRLKHATRNGVDDVERRRDEFLAVVSHELKHPLNLISANAELIARAPEGRNTPVIGRAAATIRRTVLSQAQIIDDLLDMSRLRTGKLSISRTPVDLKEVVQRICHTLQDDAQRKDIEFRLSVPDEPVSINADLTRIEQIVWNLVSNAVKFTDADGKITVALTLDPRSAILKVSDNGTGIDPAGLPHIFDMYRQGRAASTSRRGGLGIGLSLVKELVAVHGGRVGADSDGLGHGATFTVELPRIVEAVTETSGGAYPSTFLDGAQILLVDDDEATVETFRLLLEMEGAKVSVATNGEDALKALETEHPMLILSDIGMPGMNGFEFIEAVRRRPELADVKAIALSGFGRQADIDEALQAGFDAHLTKPVMLDALLSTIARLRLR